MTVPNLIPYKMLYISDYICSCYAFVFILWFHKLISKHILQFHASHVIKALVAAEGIKILYR